MSHRTVRPTRRQCACMHVHYRLCDLHPQFRKKQASLERLTSLRMARRAARRTRPYVIPIVVHVVYNNRREYISFAQIRSQIRVLNDDFRARNADIAEVPAVWRCLASDAMIEFRLATRDPSGRATNGITRKWTSRTSFPPDDSVKIPSQGGVKAWPTKKYLNIWVCTLGGRLLGYAQFPGGPARTDGVVILNTAFGTTGTAASPFNKGRTTTHEIGHFLNLRHIWGDRNDCSGSDYVVDTPTQELPNYGKPSFPNISCQNGPQGDMFMNYMDYVDDAAMFMFTAGQVERAHTALDGPRKKLASQRVVKRRKRRRSR